MASSTQVIVRCVSPAAPAWPRTPGQRRTGRLAVALPPQVLASSEVLLGCVALFSFSFHLYCIDLIHLPFFCFFYICFPFRACFRFSFLSVDECFVLCFSFDFPFQPQGILCVSLFLPIQEYSCVNDCCSFSPFFLILHVFISVVINLCSVFTVKSILVPVSSFLPPSCLYVFLHLPFHVFSYFSFFVIFLFYIALHFPLSSHLHPSNSPAFINRSVMHQFRLLQFPFFSSHLVCVQLFPHVALTFLFPSHLHLNGLVMQLFGPDHFPLSGLSLVLLCSKFLMHKTFVCLGRRVSKFFFYRVC